MDAENGDSSAGGGEQTLYQKYKKFLIMIGAGTGLTIGVVAKASGTGDAFNTIIGYPGELFINALMLMVVPYICAAMVASQRPDPNGDDETAGMMSLGVTCYGCTTMLAVVEALIFTNIFAPGGSGEPPPRDPLGVGCENPDYKTEEDCVAALCPCNVARCKEDQKPCEWGTGLVDLEPEFSAVRDSRGRLYFKVLPSHEDEVKLGELSDNPDYNVPGTCSPVPYTPSAGCTVAACSDALSRTDCVSFMCGDALQCEWTADFGDVTDVVSAIPHGISSLDAVLSIGFQILPRNVISTFASGNLLGLIVFSVLFGKALAKQGQKAEAIFDMVETCGDALMSVVMSVVEFTPLGVGSLIAAGIAQMGDGSLAPYATFIVMALLAQLCHLAVLFGVLTVLAPGCNAKEYYSNLRPAMIMAMATDSSAATLPVTMACARVNRLRQRTIDLIFPLGATVNMDGSTIYYVQAVIFLAGMSGYNMGFAEQVQTGVVGALICCGAAPVPGGFIIFIWMILNLVGVPDKCDIEYLHSSLAVLLAINWFMDRCRTTVNVVGDSVVAGIVEYKIYGGRAFSGQAPAQDALGGEVKGSGELSRGLSSQTSNPTEGADVSEL